MASGSPSLSHCHREINDAAICFLFSFLCCVRKAPSALLRSHGLQQMAGNPVWGWAAKGKSHGQDKLGRDPSETPGGRWMVIYTQGRNWSQGHDPSDNKIVLKRTSGKFGFIRAIQHGWSTGNSFEAEKETKVDLPHFRIFRSAASIGTNRLRKTSTVSSRWKPCDPKSAAELPLCLTISGKYPGPRGPRGHHSVGLRRHHRGGCLGTSRKTIRGPKPKRGYDEVSKRMIAREAKQGKAGWFEELAEYNEKIDRGRR